MERALFKKVARIAFEGQSLVGGQWTEKVSTKKRANKKFRKMMKKA